jgi:hypothetical protein
MKSVATFDILKSGQWPDFMKNEVKFGRFWRHWTDEKWSVRAENMLFWPPSAHFAHLLPTFILNVAAGKPLVSLGLWVLWPLSHFFYNYLIKKLKIYNK